MYIVISSSTLDFSHSSKWQRFVGWWVGWREGFAFSSPNYLKQIWRHFECNEKSYKKLRDHGKIFHSWLAVQEKFSEVTTSGLFKQFYLPHSGISESLAHYHYRHPRKFSQKNRFFKNNQGWKFIGDLFWKKLKPMAIDNSKKILTSNISNLLSKFKKPI
jgi:hypothetical protein